MRQTLNKTNDMALTTKTISNTIKEDCKELEESILPFAKLFQIQHDQNHDEKVDRKKIKPINNMNALISEDIVDTPKDKAG